MRTNEIIRKRRKELGLTLEEVGLALGVNKSTILRYESKDIEKMPIDVIPPLAKVLRCTPEYLMGWSDDDEKMYKSAGIDFIRIPLYGPLCCGNGGFVEDNIIEYVPVPSKGLNKSANEYFAQIASGESMKDAGINNGDLLVFERAGAINIGVIGCFCIDENEATCKKYKEMNGIIMLQPMNSEFEPIIIDPMSNSFRVLGILKKVIKDID